MLFECVFLAVSLVIVINVLFYEKCYWTQRGVINVVTSGVFDNIFKIFNKKSEFDIIKNIYDKFNDAPYVGFYRNGKPRILLRDPGLIKYILVKEFDKFESRGIKSDPADVLSQNILFAERKKWKLLRSKLSPAFTSRKLKLMIPLILKCNEQLFDRIDNSLAPSSSSAQNNNLRTTIADYTTSVMTSVAFGIESGTLSNDNNDTPFKEIGRSFFEKNKKNHWFFKYFTGSSRFRREDKQFINLFKDVINKRKNEGTRYDFIDLCLDLKNKSILRDTEAVGDFTIAVTDELLAAQAFFFFLAGNDSAETVITFALYELAHNELCLRRLHEEIDALIQNGQPTYELLKQARYLECVIKETMRKYPPIGHLQRMCNETYTLPDGKTIEPGIRCTVSVLAMHRDENFYPEPSKFDPDRFLDGKLEHSDVYMPFGKGPRQCIGIRLGVHQVKMGLFTLLTKFTVKSDEVYQEYLEIQDIFVAIKPKNIQDVKIIRRSSLH